VFESFVHDWALRAAAVLDAIAATIVFISALCAVLIALWELARRDASPRMSHVRGLFSRWLALALELLIGSDIIRTAVSASWRELGQLATIIALRVALEFTLVREFPSNGGNQS
jgi:uncharacterized membrane protein